MVRFKYGISKKKNNRNYEEKQMDGWMEGKTNRRTNKQMTGHMDKWMDLNLDEQQMEMNKDKLIYESRNVWTTG